MGKRQLELVMALLILIGSFYIGRLGAQMRELHETYAAAVSAQIKEYKVVIDAGHGGFDSGKAGIDGILEKEVNLAIAKKLEEKLKVLGIEVLMTRDTDGGLYDEAEENKKQQDMKRRCVLINESDADLAVSIHQNSYTQESVYGPQVFYYETSQNGKMLAEILQESLNQELQIAHPREIKSDRTYYILRKTKLPTVIVECGFLSNREDAAKLTDADYQLRVAQAVCDGILEYLQKEQSIL